MLSHQTINKLVEFLDEIINKEHMGNILETLNNGLTVERLAIPLSLQSTEVGGSAEEWEGFERWFLGALSTIDDPTSPAYDPAFDIGLDTDERKQVSVILQRLAADIPISQAARRELDDCLAGLT